LERIRHLARVFYTVPLAPGDHPGCRSAGGHRGCPPLPVHDFAICAVAASVQAPLNACLTNAATEQDRIATTPLDETICAQLYDGCDCHTVNTAARKQACGLARLPPDAGVGG